ncbi:MAG: hypothetical protein P1U40_01360 [Coxiellaceae bacterium]|nr:hypothetical protein [Coxiellaceae bacterium]
MIKRTMITLLISAGFLFSSAAFAAEASNQPTPKQVNAINGKLFQDLSEQVFFRLRNICEGRYVCDCIKNKQQQTEVALGDDYLIVKAVCKNASH